MTEQDFLRKMIIPAKTKIVLIVMDGLGGLAVEPGGKTELETAYTPNMDCLAAEGDCGLTIPVMPGITSGSGPGHLALFGYDPFQYEIGRGAMEAMGVDFELLEDDVAARGNFCTIDETGQIIDRRAGRLPTEQSRELAALLNTIRMEGVEFFCLPVKEHRFAVVMRGEGLGEAVTGTDPLSQGGHPLQAEALEPASQKTADAANYFIAEARKLFAGRKPANMITLRGFARLPNLPKYAELYKMKAAAIAVQGMYRGVARMAGMEVLPLGGINLEDEFTALEQHWNDFDFFYLHVKKTDLCGENGDFSGKVAVIEAVDRQLTRVMALQPDVVIITGDHSSPAALCGHSWHPVPVLLWSKFCRGDRLQKFGERECQHGSLGVIRAKELLPIALANAGRIEKFGG